MKLAKSLSVILLICLMPLLGGWSYPNGIQASMRELGFRLKKKENITIPYSNRIETRYVFTHRIHSIAIVHDYHNGFVDIQARYRSSKKEPKKWDLVVSRTVRTEEFRNAIYRVFVLGDSQ